MIDFVVLAPLLESRRMMVVMLGMGLHMHEIDGARVLAAASIGAALEIIRG